MAIPFQRSFETFRRTRSRLWLRSVRDEWRLGSFGERRRLLSGHGITGSMSRRANCWDNPPIESFFASLKKELLHDEDYQRRAEARASLFEFMEVSSNRVRRHSSLDYRSPVEFERAKYPLTPRSFFLGKSRFRSVYSQSSKRQSPVDRCVQFGHAVTGADPPGIVERTELVGEANLRLGPRVSSFQSRRLGRRLAR